MKQQPKSIINNLAKWAMPCIILITVMIAATATAQVNVTDSTLYYFRGHVTMNGKTIKNTQLVTLMKSCPDALHHMKIAKSRKSAETGLITAGTIILLPTIIYGTAIQASTKTPSNAAYTTFFILAGVGISLDVIGLIAGSGSNKHKAKAVELYNDCRKNREATTRVQLKLGTTTHGIGLAVRF